MGGAGSVKEWRDCRTGVSYGGFPYAHWRQGSGASVISTYSAS